MVCDTRLQVAKQKRIRATYGPNYERLRQVKAAYDPENLFRVNQNIQPAENGQAPA